MNTIQTHDEERIQQGIAELQAMIRERFAEAVFAVFRGDDPEGVYLRVTVDVEDTDEVVDAIIDRLLELQVEEELPLYVVPVRPVKRSLEAASRVSNTRRHDVAPM
jgi:hypothetical protein